MSDPNIVMHSPPKNRSDFERRSYLLAEKIINQKVKFHSRAVNTLDGIKNVKYLPNNRIDFLTINESVRVLLLALEGMPDNIEE